jgi:hypothetical protein
MFALLSPVFLASMADHSDESAFEGDWNARHAVQHRDADWPADTQYGPISLLAAAWLITQVATWVVGDEDFSSHAGPSDGATCHWAWRGCTSGCEIQWRELTTWPTCERIALPSLPSHHPPVQKRYAWPTDVCTSALKLMANGGWWALLSQNIVIVVTLLATAAFIAVRAVRHRQHEDGTSALKPGDDLDAWLREHTRQPATTGVAPSAWERHTPK